MKYLRATIIFLVFVLLGIGVYYAYIKISPPKSTPVVSNVQETPRPLKNEDIGKKKIINKFSEYTRQDSIKAGNPILVQGVFQAVDTQNKDKDGVFYNYVIGIVLDDGSLATVWLTTNEYEQISGTVSKFAREGVPVTITLAGDIVNITTPYESTAN